MTRTLALLALLLGTARADETDLDAPDGVRGECIRAIGGTMGIVPAGVDWELIGNGPVLITGSPALHLSCHGPGKTRPEVAITTAPLQTHYYRNLGRASLLVVPQFGFERGEGRVRWGAHAILFPELIGGGFKLEYRFSGDNWLVKSRRHDLQKGLMLHANVLDGDPWTFQLGLLYTFGVNPL